jgi:hypothetical protein
MNRRKIREAREQRKKDARSATKRTPLKQITNIRRNLNKIAKRTPITESMKQTDNWKDSDWNELLIALGLYSNGGGLSYSDPGKLTVRTTKKNRADIHFKIIKAITNLPDDELTKIIHQINEAKLIRKIK